MTPEQAARRLVQHYKGLELTAIYGAQELENNIQEMRDRLGLADDRLWIRQTRAEIGELIRRADELKPIRIETQNRWKRIYDGVATAHEQLHVLREVSRLAA